MDLFGQGWFEEGAEAGILPVTSQSYGETASFGGFSSNTHRNDRQASPPR
jgi:hypothetical protein